MRTTGTVAILAFAALAAAQPPAWPCFRGPNRDGAAQADARPPLEWSNTKNLAWRVALPGPGASSPIVCGDRVFVTCYTGYGAHLDDGGDFKKLVHHLVCVARERGAILWQRAVPGPLPHKARPMQLTEHGFASPTPATDGRAVYCYFGRAGVVAFDLDGKVLWQTDLGEPTKGAPPPTNTVEHKGKVLSLRWGTAASPLVCGDLVLVNASEQSNSIRALDRATGKLRWTYESANLEGCATTPAVVAVGKTQQVVMCLGGAVWGLGLEDGKLRWQVETGTRGGMSPTPVSDAERVYTFGGDGKSFALWLTPRSPQGAATATGERGPVDDRRIAWKGANVDIPSPALHDGKLFLVSQSGIGTVVTSRDGKTLVTGRLEGRTGKVYASPLIAAGRMYVVSRKRGTFVYSADEKLRLLHRNELDDESVFNGSPAVDGPRLFLRSDKFLYCLATRGV
ncbi:MAG: PQQ-binding-like beta-propeller repeat protein [Planctomycetes bacterium]|nr:PQQ-binding-like beta-propeller repeat protein [Planctomycetota bacterium]